MEKLANHFVEKQIEKGMIAKEEKEIYQYGYLLLLELLFNISIAAAIGIAFHSLFEVFLFLLFFIPIRSFAGGYHANSYLKCAILSAGIILCLCLLIKYVPLEKSLPIGLSLGSVSAVFVWLLAPVDSVKKPLNEAEHRKYRYYSRVMLIVELMISGVLYACGRIEYSVIGLFAVLIVTLSLLAGKKFYSS